MSTTLDGSVGVGVQTVYGTAVTPTRWYPVQSASVEPEFIETTDTAIMGGGFGSRKSARKRTGQSASGSLSMEVLNKKMALLLQHVTGTAPAPVTTGDGFTYTMPFTRNFGKHLTVQLGVPDNLDEQPLTMVGGKIMTATFACERDGNLMMDLDLDGRQVVDDIALAAPSYTPALVPFDFSQMSVKIGTYGEEAVVDGIAGISTTFERPLKVDSRYAGSAGLKSEPSMNGRPSMAGTLDVDFLDKTVFLDRYLEGTAFSLVWEFLGTSGTGYQETWRLTLPHCEFDSSVPGLEGEDQVAHSMDFVALRDDENGRAMATLTYISTDTA